MRDLGDEIGVFTKDMARRKRKVRSRFTLNALRTLLSVCDIQ